MKINKLNSIIILGLVAIIGILIAQLLWTKEAFTLEQKKLSQKTHIALLEVAKKLYEGTNHELPAQNPVQKIANDYYIVNIDNDFEPDILEFYLKSEFKKMNITTDFEYAMYNCQSDEMIYGNYISLSEKSKAKQSVYFPKHQNLIYYFAVRFPNETSYLFSSMRFWFVLSIMLIFILLIYVYSIFTLLQQKKYSELQRDFINNMTHEFKTPLSSILIASKYLIEQNPIKEDKKLHTYTDIIINQSNKLNSHIEKILNVAKSDYTALELKIESVLIVPVLEEAIQNIQLKYPDANITIESNTDDHQIATDIFHFSNLVYNLLDNAVKYCDSQPEILIRITIENQILKLEFIDNGIGITIKNIPFIFDKFYRIQNSKSNEVNGFGLGLYYVKKICTLQSWKIAASNNSVNGTTITLSIPYKK
ncbi:MULTISPECIES: sensor histidine kinase [Flavobacterium]|uniref:histidine kinase n=2 Tax=Flavobacterium TaxID=237 RepID=A0A940XF94_9FLAO|nr:MULTISPECIES: HAMP domain-containing sensor histidine kinase [Flavobacterium]MBP4138203.1 HAMP domain-containing histidine kinase [Flavobacterium geliluteum]MDX6183342.1 HAMP domain-containing sensor histidine kinase [Flavobacterium sp. Fl-33]MDX6186626.1 HAMP domain-containing sensor histidine kinase [Flavobacterium sp. Fl-77]UFH38605.1 HAMP domain-containing histidine kinase [Flavobacterium sp. F-70]